MNEIDRSKKISIIIPVYNAEKLIEATLKSVIQQYKTYNDFEVIIVNDGSTDKSRIIIEDVVKRNLNIQFKLFNRENHGVSDSRNFGVEVASGEYVIFLDSDDELNSNMLYKLNKVICKEYDLILFNYEFLDFWKNRKKRIIFQTNSREISIDQMQIEAIENENLNSVWQFCISKKFIKRNHIMFNKDIKVGEDMLFNLDMLSFCPKIYYLNECLYKYNHNDSSVMNKNNIESIDRRLKDSTKVYLKNFEYAEKWNKSTLENKRKIASKYYDLLNFEFNQLINCKEPSIEKINLMKKYININETLIARRNVKIRDFLFNDKLFIYCKMPYMYLLCRKIKIFVKRNFIERKK